MVDHSYDIEDVGDQVAFYLLIKWTVTRQTWAQIHLKQPWIKSIVNEYIKSKKLEAIGSVGHILFKCLGHRWFNSQQSFIDDVINS